MPQCLKPSLGFVPGAGFVRLGVEGVGAVQPLTYLSAYVADSSGTSLADCAAVSISGAEYLALKSGSGSSGTVQTPSYPAWNELGSLSIADAQVISLYVGVLWAGVWGIKQIVKSLSIFERNQDE